MLHCIATLMIVILCGYFHDTSSFGTSLSLQPPSYFLQYTILEGFTSNLPSMWPLYRVQDTLESTLDCIFWIMIFRLHAKYMGHEYPKSRPPSPHLSLIRPCLRVIIWFKEGKFARTTIFARWQATYWSGIQTRITSNDEHVGDCNIFPSLKTLTSLFNPTFNAHGNLAIDEYC